MIRTSIIAALAAGALALSAVAATPVSPGAKAPQGEKTRAKAEGAKIGEKAPDFTLTDVTGKTFKLSDATAQGKIVVLEWFNPDCPAVVLHHEKNPTFKNLAKEFEGKDVVMVAINSGAPGKQGAGKDRNVRAHKDYGMSYPVLLDEEGTVGKKYGARTTPHMFVIGKDGVLAYAGAIDNGNPGKAGDKNYVSLAVNELLAGQTVTTPETRAYGCSVKYKN